jgi:hypothetical protein
MGLKEAPYVMTMMTMYGTLGQTGKETVHHIGPSSNQQRIKFRYPEVFNHFSYRHMVDDHNSRQHAATNFEESLGNKNMESSCVFISSCYY